MWHGQKCKGGKCRNGKRRRINIWKTIKVGLLVTGQVAYGVTAYMSRFSKLRTDG